MCYGDNDAAIQANAVGVGPGSNSYLVRYMYNLYSANPTQLQAFIASNIDSVTFSMLPPATYFVTIYDSSYGAYCSTDTLVVTEPPVLTSYVSIDSASNLWTLDGDLVIDSVTGGTPNYTYQWFDAFNNLISINPFVNNVSSGWYQLYVTDANGCIDIGNYYIPAGISCDSLSIDTIIRNNVLCTGDSTGSAIVYPDSIGGVPIFCHLPGWVTKYKND